MTLDPAVAAVRRAVRRSLADVDDGSVLVACSGGADSLALLAGAVFETRRSSLRVVGVCVDHGLQDGSEAHTARVIDQMAALGADETVGVRVRVEASGQGPEAAAREARYAVLGEVAQRLGTDVVLLGHTLDDQAETVLMGLTRGSGARSLAGMRRAFEVYRRPLLDLTRVQTEAACRAEDIDFWSDPHNSDPRFLRSRVRHTVLPLLEAELGPGVAATLARTADQVRDDQTYLAEVADAALAEVAAVTADGGLSADALAALPRSVRTRVLRSAAVAAGAPPSEVTAHHVGAMEELVTAWRGQRWIDLPGPLRCVRRDGVLRWERPET